MRKIKENMDKECICCRRLYSGSCEGIEDRRREKITLENCCAAHLFVYNESDCLGEVKRYNEIKKIEEEIGINW